MAIGTKMQLFVNQWSCHIFEAYILYVYSFPSHVACIILLSQYKGIMPILQFHE